LGQPPLGRDGGEGLKSLAQLSTLFADWSISHDIGAEAANRILHPFATLRPMGRLEQVFKRTNLLVKMVVRDHACVTGDLVTPETDLSQPPIISTVARACKRVKE
jgi:hypothetical protein